MIDTAGKNVPRDTALDDNIGQSCDVVRVDAGIINATEQKCREPNDKSNCAGSAISVPL